MVGLSKVWKALTSYSGTGFGKATFGVTSVGVFILNPLMITFGGVAIGTGIAAKYLENEYQEQINSLVKKGVESLNRASYRTDIKEKAEHVNSAISFFAKAAQPDVLSDPIKTVFSIISDPHNVRLMSQYANDEGKQTLLGILKRGSVLSRGKDYQLQNHLDSAIRMLNNPDSPRAKQEHIQTLVSEPS